MQFRSRQWGSSLPGLRTRGPPLSPPSTWAEIFRHMCLQSHLPTSPQTPQKSYPFRNPRTNFEIFNFNFFLNLKSSPMGPGGVSEFFGGLISPFFVRINPLWSFRTLTDLLLKFSKKNFKNLKIAHQGARGWGSEFYFFLRIFIIFFRGLCKIWKPYDNSFLEI
jgi:hypothetical protein